MKPRASRVELREIGMVFELSCEDQRHTVSRVRAQVGGFELSQKDPRGLLEELAEPQDWQGDLEN